MRKSRPSRQAVEVTAPRALRVTRAVDHGELEDAFRCLYDSYCKRGLTTSHPFQIRLTRHHLVPTTHVFVARIDRQVVGTLSLVEDEPLGVPMRSVFGDSIEQLTRQTPRIAEATCLAVRGAPVQGMHIVHRLIGLIFQSAQRRGVSRLLIAVNPRHVPFYVRVAGFQPFASTKPYPSVGGLPAVALQLNLATLHVDAPAVHRRYFGMTFSPGALSTGPVAPHTLRRLATSWQGLHEEAVSESVNDSFGDGDVVQFRYAQQSAPVDAAAPFARGGTPCGLDGMRRRPA